MTQDNDRPALDLATRYRQRFLAALGHTQCARLRAQVVYAPGGPGSCAAPPCSQGSACRRE